MYNTLAMYNSVKTASNANNDNLPPTSSYPYLLEEDDPELSRIREELGEIGVKLKEEKIKMYRLDKEDIVMMDKVKYLQENISINKPRGTTFDWKQKNVIAGEIAEIINEINLILDERNKIES